MQLQTAKLVKQNWKQMYYVRIFHKWVQAKQRPVQIYRWWHQQLLYWGLSRQPETTQWLNRFWYCLRHSRLQHAVTVTIGWWLMRSTVSQWINLNQPNGTQQTIMGSNNEYMTQAAVQGRWKCTYTGWAKTATTSGSKHARRLPCSVKERSHCGRRRPTLPSVVQNQAQWIDFESAHFCLQKRDLVPTRTHV